MFRFIILLALLLASPASAQKSANAYTSNAQGIGQVCTEEAHDVCWGYFTIASDQIQNNSGWTSFDSQFDFNYLKIGPMVHLSFSGFGTASAGRRRFDIPNEVLPPWIRVASFMGARQQGGGTSCVNADTTPGTGSVCGSMFCTGGGADAFTVEHNIAEAISNRQIWGHILYRIR